MPRGSPGPANHRRWCCGTCPQRRQRTRRRSRGLGGELVDDRLEDALRRLADDLRGQPALPVDDDRRRWITRHLEVEHQHARLVDDGWIPDVVRTPERLRLGVVIADVDPDEGDAFALRAVVRIVEPWLLDAAGPTPR